MERSEGIGFGREFLAAFLCVPLETLNSAIEKCKTEGRIQELPNNALFITNFDKYQAIPEDKHKLPTLEDIQHKKQAEWDGYISNKE